MKQINLISLDWSRILPYVAIALLSIIVLSTCNNSERTQLANEVLKSNIKISELQAQKYASRINVLNDSLVILNKLKQKEIVKIKVVVKEVKEKVEAVGSLNTKGIANYYQNRYKLPVTITQYGVALSDTLAKKNIVDVIERDGFKTQLFHTKNALNISDKEILFKEIIIKNKDSIIYEKINQINSHIDFEKNITKDIKSERVKKNIWKVTAIGILTGSIYLLAK